MMTPIGKVVLLFEEKKRFVLMTHENPDGDGIGSMLALGRSLRNAGKDVTLLAREPVPSPLNNLRGADRIVNRLDSVPGMDAAVILDCAEKARLGRDGLPFTDVPILVNIDHHETNDYFGTLNVVEPESSSTGELVFRLIQEADLPMDMEVAENLFAAIQSDTGSFTYGNTTPACLRMAASLMEKGVCPWDVSRRVLHGYNLPRLRLLELALPSIELHHDGQIATMTVSRQMFQKAGAEHADSERFVDYPRFISGVELGVLICEVDEAEYKFSLRSNSRLNVARLASCFGGGGHDRAAGFRYAGSLTAGKSDFLKEAVQFLDGSCN